PARTPIRALEHLAKFLLGSGIIHQRVEYCGVLRVDRQVSESAGPPVLVLHQDEVPGPAPVRTLQNLAIPRRIEGGRDLVVDRQRKDRGRRETGSVPANATVGALEHTARCRSIESGWCYAVDREGLHADAGQPGGVPTSATVGALEHPAVRRPRIEGGWRYGVDCQSGDISRAVPGVGRRGSQQDEDHDRREDRTECAPAAHGHAPPAGKAPVPLWVGTRLHLTGRDLLSRIESPVDGATGTSVQMRANALIGSLAVPRVETTGA